MPEIGTSGLMSEDGKRGSRYRARPRLYPGVTWIGWREWHKALAYCRKLGV